MRDSATTITRLTSQSQDEAKTFQDRDLSNTDYIYLRVDIYLWVDGIHLKVRLENVGFAGVVFPEEHGDGAGS